MAAKAVRAAPSAPGSRSWTDADVSAVLVAEMLLTCAGRGVPGFEPVHALARKYEEARTAIRHCCQRVHRRRRTEADRPHGRGRPDRRLRNRLAGGRDRSQAQEESSLSVLHVYVT